MSKIGVFLDNHKKACTIAVITLVSVLLAIYLYALFLPGIWHENAFLYKLSDNNFVGSDNYAQYKMTVLPDNENTVIYFSVNDTTNKYEIKNSSPSVEIYKNGEHAFKGEAMAVDNGYILFDENKNMDDVIDIRAGNEIPSEEELFPSYSRLYTLAVSQKYDTRGNLFMLFGVLICGIILALDISFPNLFFHFEHGIYVDGGEPNDCYRTGQALGRFVLAVVVAACIIMSFTVH